MAKARVFLNPNDSTDCLSTECRGDPLFRSAGCMKQRSFRYSISGLCSIPNSQEDDDRADDVVDDVYDRESLNNGVADARVSSIVRLTLPVLLSSLDF